MNARKRKVALLHALSHPVRLQILEIISQAPRCVCDLVALTGKRQPYVSQHLAILRDIGLVSTYQQGKNIFYQLNDARLAEFNQLISTLLL